MRQIQISTSSKTLSQDRQLYRDRPACLRHHPFPLPPVKIPIKNLLSIKLRAYCKKITSNSRQMQLQVTNNSIWITCLCLSSYRTLTSWPSWTTNDPHCYSMVQPCSIRNRCNNSNKFNLRYLRLYRPILNRTHLILS